MRGHNKVTRTAPVFLVCRATQCSARLRDSARDFVSLRSTNMTQSNVNMCDNVFDLAHGIYMVGREVLAFLVTVHQNLLSKITSLHKKKRSTMSVVKHE